MRNDELSQSAVGLGSKAVLITLVGAVTGARALAEKVRKGIDAYLNGRGDIKGKQSVKDLAAKGTERSLLEVDGKIEGFEKVAKKYSIDYSVLYDKSQDKTLVIFQGKDTEILNHAFKEYMKEDFEKAKPIEKVKAEIIEEKPFQLSARSKTPLLEGSYRPIELVAYPEPPSLIGRDQPMPLPSAGEPLLLPPGGRPLYLPPRQSLFEKVAEIEARQSDVASTMKSETSKGIETLSKETVTQGSAQTVGAAANVVTDVAKQVHKTLLSSLEVSK